MKIDKRAIKEKALKINVLLDENQIDQFEIYINMLLEWNQKMNLTAIKEPEQIIDKHFIDSLTILPFLPKSSLSLIDVGTGAGFPGVPIAIVREDIKLTLLDSLNKRLLFLKDLCSTLNIPVDIVHERAEDAGKKIEYREKYDIVTARAVASLPVLCEYCIPLVKLGGQFIAMKGPDGDRELKEAESAIKVLGAQVNSINKIILNSKEETMDRRLIVIDKKYMSDKKYPRIPAKIEKQPL